MEEKNLNRHFPREHIQRVNTHRKRCSTFPVFRKMQSETAARPRGDQDGYCQAPEDGSVQVGVGTSATAVPCELLLGAGNGAAAVENSNGSSSRNQNKTT